MGRRGDEKLATAAQLRVRSGHERDHVGPDLIANDVHFVGERRPRGS